MNYWDKYILLGIITITIVMVMCFILLPAPNGGCPQGTHPIGTSYGAIAGVYSNGQQYQFCLVNKP